MYVWVLNSSLKLVDLTVIKRYNAYTTAITDLWNSTYHVLNVQISNLKHVCHTWLRKMYSSALH